jgi:hypothetical protein
VAPKKTKSEGRYAQQFLKPFIDTQLQEFIASNTESRNAYLNDTSTSLCGDDLTYL